MHGLSPFVDTDVTTHERHCYHVLQFGTSFASARYHCCYHARTQWLPFVPFVTFAGTVRESHSYCVLHLLLPRTNAFVTACYHSELCLLPLLLPCTYSYRLIPFVAIAVTMQGRCCRLLPFGTSLVTACYHAPTPFLPLVTIRTLPCYRLLPFVLPCTDAVVTVGYRLMLLIIMHERCCLLLFVNIRNLPCYRVLPLLLPCTKLPHVTACCHCCHRARTP